MTRGELLTKKYDEQRAVPAIKPTRCSCGSAALQCGKALPYRRSSIQINGGCASNSERHSLDNKRVSRPGKAEPYRTGGGRAAKQPKPGSA